MTLNRRDFSRLALAAGAAPWLSRHAFAQSSSPVSGGTLTIGDQNAPAQLVATNNTGTGQNYGPKIFDGLLSYDFTLNPKPQIAQSWSISPDGLEYVFNLRPGITFHDGAPLTSVDVAFSLLRLKEAHPRGRVTFAHVSAIDTSDPLVARLKLDQPTPALITALAASESPIVPKHVFKAFPAASDPKKEQLIGSGPFRLTEWVVGSYFILEKNPHYWDAPRPYLDRIIVRTIPDAGARSAAIETGEIDFASVPFADLARLKAEPGISVDATNYAYAGPHSQLIINLDNAFLKSLPVRQAIAHAIDVKKLIDIVYFGYATPSPTAISSLQPKYHNDAIKAPTVDPALAESLLEQAGYPRRDGGWRFSLRLTSNPAIPTDIQDFLKNALGKIGINVTDQVFDFPTYVHTVYTDRAWDLSVEGLFNTFDPTVGVQRIFWSKNFKVGLPFSNASHYSNAEVDRLLEAAAVEPDTDKRAALFKQFQVIVAQDLPVIDLFDPGNPLVTRSHLKDFAVDAAGGAYGSFAHAWIDPSVHS